ncbi:unnamed protein product [Prunus armeniaca]|uniref:Uncharacterized protein n=1 Tax=Prunus armeniaca TaxID=36596 RepID=A0A6J5TJ25_PRUAR|nr:unnamed protein product [Prunus armeniaca]
MVADRGGNHIISRFNGEDGEQCGVEQLALQQYAGEGWDVTFSDIPNVFCTRFQTWSRFSGFRVCSVAMLSRSMIQVYEFNDKADMKLMSNGKINKED